MVFQYSCPGPGICHISGVFPLLGERTSPTLGCSIKILLDIYIGYVCRISN